MSRQDPEDPQAYRKNIYPTRPMPSSSRQEERCCSSELTTALLPFCILWSDPACPVCTAITRMDAIDRREFCMSRACPQSQWISCSEDGTILIISDQIRFNQIRLPKIALDQSCTRRRRRSSCHYTSSFFPFSFFTTLCCCVHEIISHVSPPASQPAVVPRRGCH